MPLTYSIAYGVVAGLVAYFIINGTNWLLDNVTSGARSLPQWVAHVRQVSCLLLPATCVLLPAASACCRRPPWRAALPQRQASAACTRCSC